MASPRIWQHAIVLTGALLLTPLSPDGSRSAWGQAASSVPALSPVAASWLEKWQLEASEARATRAKTEVGLTGFNRLVPAAALDRRLREGVTELMKSDVPPTERGQVLRVMFAVISAVDRENTEILRANLPATGWFVDTAIASDAWLIAQHSSDRELQKEVLGRLERTARAGAFNGWEYARLYDRLELFQGRPQRYGSQARCISGTWSFGEVPSEQEVERQRAVIGWTESLEQTKMRLNIGAPC